MLKTRLMWAVEASLYAVLLYFAIAKGNQGMENLFVSLIVVRGALYPFLLREDMAGKITYMHKAVPVSLRNLVNWGFVFVLVWYGWWVCAFFMWAPICVWVAAEHRRKLREGG